MNADFWANTQKARGYPWLTIPHRDYLAINLKDASYSKFSIP